MKRSAISPLVSIAVWIATPGLAMAQQAPAPAEQRPPLGSEADRTLPAAPAERFARCAEIRDRSKREACIERQTSTGNPATRTVEEPAEAPADITAPE